MTKLTRFLLVAALVAGVSLGSYGADTPPEGVVLVDLTTATSGSVIEDTNPYNSGSYRGAKAFDDITSGGNERWLAKKGTSSAPTYITYQFNDPTAVNAYRIYNGGSGGANQPERAPRDWTFEGSNDNENWMLLDSRSGEKNWTSGEVRYFSCSESANVGKYRYYRLTLANNNGNDLYQIHEICFHYVISFALEDCAATRNTDGSYDVSATVRKDSVDSVTAYAKTDDDGNTVSAVIGTDVAQDEEASGTISGFESGLTYELSVAAQKGNDALESPIAVVYAGELSIEWNSDAQELGCVPGRVKVSRANASKYPLAVNYTLTDGTAEVGVDYVAGSGTVTIPANEADGYIEVVPLVNPDKTSDSTLTVSIASGNYAIPANGVTMTIVNASIPADKNVWIAGSTSDGLASTASNWSKGVPTAGNDGSLVILVDGNYSSHDMTWDAGVNGLASTVTSWTQTEEYAGTVTMKTVFPGKGTFEIFTVTGAMTINGGTLTHPQSVAKGDKITDPAAAVADLIANETYRLRMDVASLVVGSAAKIDVTNKGYYMNNTGSNIMPLPSHGGMFAGGSAPYDNPKEPIHVGMPYKRDSGAYTFGIGGGAIYITCSGDAVINGALRADTGADPWSRGYTLRAGGGAGSIYLMAATIAGTGAVSANAVSTGEQNNKGCGGCVALVSTTTTPVDITELTVEANVYPFKSNGTTECDTHGSAGTVFLKDATQENGTLIVDNYPTMPTQALTRPVTVLPAAPDGGWVFDSIGLGHNAILSIPAGMTIRVPFGIGNVFSLNAPGETNLGSIRYEGGVFDIGTATEQVMSGAWIFTGWSNYVFNCDLTVKDGAAIGVPAVSAIADGDANLDVSARKLPAFVSCSVVVNGNLTVESTGLIKADSCGFKKKDHNNPSQWLGVLGYGCNGGRHQSKGKGDYTAATNFYYKGHGSAFHPALPGCSGFYGNGSSSSGGAMKLVVKKHLLLDGSVSACGMPIDGRADQNNAGGAGGSIDITAGSISGTGSILANGGSISSSQGGGGRIAVRLTDANADFSQVDLSKIAASGRSYNGTSTSWMGTSSPGTVYLQAGNEAERAGLIQIKSFLSNSYYHLNNSNTTEIVSLGYGGDAVEDYKKVKVEVRDYGRAAVNTDVQLAQMTVATTDAFIDLEGHTLTVNGFAYPVVGEGGTVTLKKLSSGEYKIGSAMLPDCVYDSSAEQTGTVIVTGGGLTIVIR